MKYDTRIIKSKAPSLLDLATPLTELKKISNSHGGEWSGPCPFCYGTDRFSVQPNSGEGRWLCRHCTDGKWRDVIEFIERRDNIGFLDACKLLFGDNVAMSIDQDDLKRIRREREEQDQARIEQELDRQELVRGGLADAWKPFYENLINQPDRIRLWGDRGLSTEFIEYYKVGYCPNREFYSPFVFESATLTIPTWRGGECIGLVHRLLMDDPPGGKYRPHVAGAGKPIFFGDVHQKSGVGDVLLLEGEIKTMVTFSHIWRKDPCQPHPIYGLNLAGIAGKSFKQSWTRHFENSNHIYILLDPDASGASYKIAGLLGRDRCSIAHLPAKIDDMLIAGHINPDILWRVLKHSD